MNIDERLDRLTERHEALTQTVELLAADIREIQNAQREMLGVLRDMQSLPRDTLSAMQEAQRGNMQIFGVVLDSIKRLENIATAHEHRIDRLEDRSA